jgi:glycosyltransferase involved in cell wall biosynthesis
VSRAREDDIKIAYVHSMAFPCKEANAYDSMWSAAALAEKVDTTFFMPRLRGSKATLREYYRIPGSGLRFQSMNFDRIPDRLLMISKNYYEHALSSHLRFVSRWARFSGQKVLYAREPRQLLFWGLQKRDRRWLQGWRLFYEAHDHLGMDARQVQGVNPFDLKEGQEGERRQAILQAALQFDAIFCNTRALTDDLKSWMGDRVVVQFLTLASPLPRPQEPPRVSSRGDEVVVGYIGTIDQLRGVGILLDAMRLLPDRVRLRLVGRAREEKGVDPGWLEKRLHDLRIRDRVDLNIADWIQDVGAEIDRCDIVVQPASDDLYDSRYVAPLKSFGYMVRGKPIVAADVPCHRELFRDGENAVLYRLEPQALADCILRLVGNQSLAEKIARGAWEQGAVYNYGRKADDVLAVMRASQPARG